MNRLFTTRAIYQSWQQGTDAATLATRFGCGKKELIAILSQYLGAKAQVVFEVELFGMYCYGLGCRRTKNGMVCQLSWADAGFPETFELKGETYTRVSNFNGVTYDAEFEIRP